MTPSKSFIQTHLSNTLTEIELLLDAERKYKGKVRDTFKIENNRILIATDRQSAFDRVLAAVPFKGQVLNNISKFWFEKTKDIVKNHLIATPDPNVMVVKTAEVFPVEVIVRGFLTGSTDTSAWVNYNNGIRDFCGVTLPEGMKKNEPFKNPIITPTTKDKDHDRLISPAEIIAEKRMSQEEWEEVADIALKLFARGTEICKKSGLILVDTKFEFGKDKDGNIMLIDEVLTPDSSRFWLSETFKEKIAQGQEPDNIDKEFLRLWFAKHCDPYNDKVLPDAPADLVIELSLRYILSFEKITGEAFVPILGNPTILSRIEKNLKKYFS